MSKVVSGSAIIKPTNPNREPQTESESSNTAGLRRMALPMILGVSTMSVINCMMPNTINAVSRMNQKLSPVSTDFSRERITMGMSANEWTYG